MVTNTEIFLGSGASLTLVPELDIFAYINHTNTSASSIEVETDFLNKYQFTDNLYVGCTLDFYDASDSTTEPLSTHTITANDSNSFDITPSLGVTDADGDFIVIRKYAAPCMGEKNPTSGIPRLNADNWLGLVESATFPNVDIEMKQLNLNLGGTRNFTHQYKGIKTASGANINLAAHHGAFLYYALGQCTQVTHNSEGTPPTNRLEGATAGDVYIENASASLTGAQSSTSFASTGPIFYKAGAGSTKALLPPFNPNIDTLANVDKVNRTTSTTTVSNEITYVFKELNTGELPSFSLEQSIVKDPDTLTTETGAASESHTFVRVARGNRVNTMTITANENEEVKMTMDLNTAGVNKLSRGQSYEARGGQTSNASLFNNPTGSDDQELLDPFFFSSGKFTIFGQEFLKITNFTLTINNNLQDKRFVGIGTKDLKVGIPAQRNYELSFTALITDDLLFEELFEENMDGVTGSTDATKIIDLQFDKDNGEQIRIKFRDYHINAANVTIPEDRGPVTVEATVMPISLHEDGATVKTHWVLQG